jgi:hypothetical protein
MLPSKRMSLRLPLWVAASSTTVCALVWLCWGIYVYWNDVRLFNFLAAWIPFALSILLAFFPAEKMGTTKKVSWRGGIIAVGFIWSGVLWHQQFISDTKANKDQENLVTKAVTQSNEHSDQKFGEVRKDVQGVKTDVQGVKDAIRQSTSNLSENIGKVKIPIPLSDKAGYDVSFWPSSLSEWPISEKSLPKVNGVVTFNFTFRIKDHMAKKTRLWLRLCNGCRYAEEPPGFQNLSPHPGKGDEPTERMLVVGDFLPSAAYTPISVHVIPPAGQAAFLVGVLVGCENCDPIDADKPRVLHVNIQP